MPTPDLSRLRRLDTWLLFATALLVIAAGMGLRDPWPADEPRFALVAKQMVESGNWLFPHRGIELYSDKPPMLMWLEGLFFLLTGNWRVAFLMPSLVATLAALWCVKDLGTRLWTRKVGLYAAWALLFAFQFTYQAKRAQIDALVLGMITVANYGLLRHLLKGPDWKMWVLGWFFAGLGTITKGVGFLALVMILPAAVASLRGWPGVRVGVRDGRFWLGPLAFLVAVSIWLVPMVTTALSAGTPEYRAYLDDILLHQTAGRYAKSWDHPQPPWYFLEVMFMWVPAFLALPWAIPAWRRRLQRRDARYLLPIAWWLLVIVFFSIPHGKRDVYVMPALPMFCLALAPLLPGIVRKRVPRLVMYAVALLMVAATLYFGLALHGGHGQLAQKLYRDRGLDPAQAVGLAWVLLAMASWGIGSLLWFRRRPMAAMLSTLAGVWVLFGFGTYPLLNASSSARGVMTAVAQRIGPDAQLGLVAWKEQNLLMTQTPHTFNFGFVKPWNEQLRDGLAWQAQAPDGRWLLVQQIALPGCVDRTLAERVGSSNRRGWWLVPMAARVDCPAAPDVPANDKDTGDD